MIQSIANDELEVWGGRIIPESRLIVAVRPLLDEYRAICIVFLCDWDVIEGPFNIQYEYYLPFCSLL